jgi:hypothetical protein
MHAQPSWPKTMTGLRRSALETLRCSNPVGRGNPALATSPNGRPQTRRLPCARVTRPQVVPWPCGCWKSVSTHGYASVARADCRHRDALAPAARARQFRELSQAAGNYAPDLEAASQAAAKGYPICLYLDAGASDLSTVRRVPTALLPAARRGKSRRSHSMREATLSSSL